MPSRFHGEISACLCRSLGRCDAGVSYSRGAQAAVDQGFTTEAVLATAVRRSLGTRMRMGVLDIPSSNPWDSPTLNLGVIDCPAHRALAFKAVMPPAKLHALHDLECAPEGGGQPI